jgi:hypothetical protein
MITVDLDIGAVTHPLPGGMPLNFGCLITRTTVTCCRYVHV